MKELKIQKLDPKAIIPQRATKGSAGYDLCACLEVPINVESGAVVRIPTGIALGVDDCHYAVFIYARSGLATKFGVIPANCVGVIDSDYRGEVIVSLTNFKAETFQIQHGDRIAQMVVASVALPELVVMEELDETERGSGGFGSTGTCSQI